MYNKRLIESWHAKPISESLKIRIVIRGELFRGTIRQQIECLDSIWLHLVCPLRAAGHKVSICLATYAHRETNIVLDIISAWENIAEVNMFRQKKTENTTQADNFIHAINHCSDIGWSLLIVRADIRFKKNIEHVRLSSDVFCFQWNYFHDASLCEVPDQIHFLGKEITEKVRERINEPKVDMGTLKNGEGGGSLHNLYNVLKDIVPFSYVMHFDLQDSDFIGNYCKLRGNPTKSTLNTFFSYEKKKISVFIRAVGRIIALFKQLTRFSSLN
jgi:hypothetical protein